MTDLSDFGVGDPDDTDDEADESTADNSEEFHAPSYPRGRCPAITAKSRKRCKAPVSRMKAAGEMCGVHGRESDPWTIHDDPETLILLTGGLDSLSLADLDPDDVDLDLDRIRDALAAVQEGDR